MFGLLRKPTFSLEDWVDDVDVGSPIDSGAEEEVLALMTETPLPVSAAPDHYEDTVPRAPRPARVPQRRGLSALLHRVR